jgi:hypothetical protein
MSLAQNESQESTIDLCETGRMRLMTLTALAAIASSTAVSAPTAYAEPTSCDAPSCVPGIKGGVVLGAPCNDTGYYAFGTTSWGRLVFCGSPRRYAPRYFRSPPMAGIRAENSQCRGYDKNVAQAPDGLFLSCLTVNGSSTWVRGDT